jgi:3-methyl-2-oxobutanoate hydroxymethyltransferase
MEDMLGLNPKPPKFVKQFGDAGKAIEADAQAVSEAGAFAVVLEAMAEPLAAKITKAIPIPTIGIGASAACDGQILVMEDMLGLNPKPPKFVKQFGDAGKANEAAISGYAEEVRGRRFPTADHTYEVKD